MCCSFLVVVRRNLILSKDFGFNTVKYNCCGWNGSLALQIL